MSFSPFLRLGEGRVFYFRLLVVLCHRLIYLLYFCLSPFPECSEAPLREGRNLFCHQLALDAADGGTMDNWHVACCVLARKETTFGNRREHFLYKRLQID